MTEIMYSVMENGASTNSPHKHWNNLTNDFPILSTCWLWKFKNISILMGLWLGRNQSCNGGESYPYSLDIILTTMEHKII